MHLQARLEEARMLPGGKEMKARSRKPCRPGVKRKKNHSSTSGLNPENKEKGNIP